MSRPPQPFPGSPPPGDDHDQFPRHPWREHGPEWRRKRGFVLRRFLGVLAVFTLLVLGGMALFAYLITTLFDGTGHDVLLVWIGGCGLLIAIPLVMLALGVRTYRRYAAPLVDVMAAADAVADGDLSVRVAERGPGELARLARSFNRMTAELERSDQQRRNLTADVAHELRTPIHIVQGNLEGILDGVYAPTDEHIAATLDETRALARLVEDLQLIAAAETGQLTLVTAPVDVAELLADLVTSFGPRAEAAGITLRTTVDDGQGPLTVLGDAGRLDQALANLLVNALRHTPAGGAITLTATPAGAQSERVRITVADTGSGIPAADLPYIFDRFWRGDRARSHRDGVGGGLGLAIVRQLVEAHGGQIAVESVVGEGTRFVVELGRA
ncbi:MAG: HAMP domain-containing histidine kinase [Caldilineaceae bacterium]|nr:HAMP domain-containing histidine kinase [Caldilineaceae bacterium]